MIESFVFVVAILPYPATYVIEFGIVLVSFHRNIMAFNRQFVAVWIQNRRTLTTMGRSRLTVSSKPVTNINCAILFGIGKRLL